MPVTALASPWPCSRERISLEIEELGSTTRRSGGKLAVSQARRLLFMNKLVLTGLTQPGSFELEPGFNTLGRNPTNDFRVHDVTVSSFHCEIFVSEGSILVRDLGSTNGTYIEGQPVQEALIEPGQILRLGSMELRLESQQVTDPPRVAIPELRFEEPPSSIILADGSLSCLNHREVRALVKCVKCQRAFCEECVHVLALS